jgi:hypothetical protein
MKLLGRGAYGDLVAKPEGRLRYRREGSVKIDLKEISWEDVNWIDLLSLFRPHNDFFCLVFNNCNAVLWMLTFGN